jgi:hypothetical protein
MATLFVRCTGAYLIILGVTYAISVAWTEPSGPAALQSRLSFFGPSLTWVVLGALMLLLNKVLGRLLARGLDDQPVA